MSLDEPAHVRDRALKGNAPSQIEDCVALH
jgi:hypothetical protein